MLLNHHIFNTIHKSILFQILKGHLHGVQLTHSSTVGQQNMSAVVDFQNFTTGDSFCWHTLVIVREYKWYGLKGQAVPDLWLLTMGPIGCPEMSVIKYQSTLHEIAEERTWSENSLSQYHFLHHNTHIHSTRDKIWIDVGNVPVNCTEVQVHTLLSDLYNTECSDHGLLGCDASQACRQIPMFQKTSCLDLQAKDCVQVDATACGKKKRYHSNHYSVFLSQTFGTEMEAARWNLVFIYETILFTTQKTIIWKGPLAFQQKLSPIFLVSFRFCCNIVK